MLAKAQTDTTCPEAGGLDPVTIDKLVNPVRNRGLLNNGRRISCEAGSNNENHVEVDTDNNQIDKSLPNPSSILTTFENLFETTQPSEVIPARRVNIVDSVEEPPKICSGNANDVKSSQLDKNENDTTLGLSTKLLNTHLHDRKSNEDEREDKENKTVPAGAIVIPNALVLTGGDRSNSGLIYKKQNAATPYRQDVKKVSTPFSAIKTKLNAPSSTQKMNKLKHKPPSKDPNSDRRQGSHTGGNSNNSSGKGWRFTSEHVEKEEYLVLKKLGEGGCGVVSLVSYKSQIF